MDTGLGQWAGLGGPHLCMVFYGLWFEVNHTGGGITKVQSSAPPTHLP